MVNWGIVLLLAWQPPTKSLPGSAKSGGGYTSQSRSPILGRSRELTPAEIDRLFVEWQKPRIEPDPFGAKGPKSVKLVGTLRLRSADGKRSELASWTQPINVGIVRDWKHQTKFDRGLPYHAFVIDKPVVNEVKELPILQNDLNLGEFEARIPVGSIHRGIEKEHEFAVAISLGALAHEIGTWSTDSPVIPGSIGRVKIPGQPRLSATVQKINACGDYFAWRYDPRATIRATNELRRLGRDQALSAVEDYCKQAGTLDRHEARSPSAEEIDTADPACLQYLLELAFGELRTSRDLESEIELYEDIPFHRVHRVELSSIGSPIDYREWVDRAASKGKTLAIPLRPPNDPLVVADKFADELVERDRLFGRTVDPTTERRGGIRGHIRRQAIQLISSAAVMKAIPTLSEKDADSEAAWQAIKTDVGQLHLRWNQERDEYEPTK